MSIRDPYSFISTLLTSKKVGRNVFATFLCVMLDEAEELFGPKLNPYPYMFAGINFDSNSPHIQVWGEGKERKHKYIMIRLSRTCIRDRPLALWQLAHECVHLLSPGDHSDTTMLEEGIATWYQRHWIRKNPKIFPHWTNVPTYGIGTGYSKYIDALVLVDQLLSEDETVIKRIRSAEPRMRMIDTEVLLEHAPWISSKTAEKLVATF